ncbi:MAG: PA2169 family four-helix-bundle protein [Acidimicrobiia bacterium]|nr:PA2169 family four-helix-bundle protein [Acidimicrobiia bacterium]MDQ3501904.1 PA2169 family four-helix-bundle protein [Actinomycetota bacterium]
MSTDEQVRKNLIEVLEDGKKGFAEAADKLAESNRMDLVAKFRDYSEQRGEFASELRNMAGSDDDSLTESGSAGAALHRGWMAIKDALTGSDAEGVLDVAEQGEDHAVSEYEKALDETDISIDLRNVIERQFAVVQAAHDDVRALRDATT